MSMKSCSKSFAIFVLLALALASVAAADNWPQFRGPTGDGHTVIAYVEGGINWHYAPEELANKVFLNAGELPPPTTPGKGRKVCHGALCAADYSDTKDSNHNGLVDPEDIIVRFSNGRDDDGNGFVDDISGWDFYDDQNDPATVDSAYVYGSAIGYRDITSGNNGASCLGGFDLCSGRGSWVG